jgi:flagellar P-ring protein precursor FlgI
LFSKSPVRIKDIAIIDGIRNNQLTGFGLVTGLQGKGDTKTFKLTQKMLNNLALNHGFDIKEIDINSKNVATVLVTCNLNGFSREGDFVDVTVSSIGDAKSLEGGILMQTALKAADGNIYAVAQGRLIAGTKEQNAQNTASIPNGAIIEKSIISNFIKDNKINIILKYPDFVTANQVKEQILSINSELQIKAIDAGLIEVTLGEEELKNPVDFIAKIEVLTVTPDQSASVVIDKKTGVIVFGEDIIIQPCSVSTTFTQVKIGEQKKNPNIELKSQTVGDLVKLLNESGLKSDEIITIIEAIHKIGAINAKIILL